MGEVGDMWGGSRWGQVGQAGFESSRDGGNFVFRNTYTVPPLYIKYIKVR